MSNKIEMIVRHYVKKFLAEAVSDLDKLIEEKVRNRLELASLLKEEGPASDYRQVMSENVEPAHQRRKITPEMLGITDETWKSIYSDTLNSDNPILSEIHEPGEAPSAERPEHVPQHVMERAGLMQDFSKHMEAFDKIDRKNQVADEDLEAYNKRREMLNKNIIR